MNKHQIAIGSKTWKQALCTLFQFLMHGYQLQNTKCYGASITNTILKIRIHYPLGQLQGTTRILGLHKAFLQWWDCCTLTRNGWYTWGSALTNLSVQVLWVSTQHCKVIAARKVHSRDAIVWYILCIGRNAPGCNDEVLWVCIKGSTQIGLR